MGRDDAIEPTPGTANDGAPVAFGDQHERQQRDGYDPFAKSSGNDRNLRIPAHRRTELLVDEAYA
jgi:hypothetical protein